MLSFDEEVSWRTRGEVSRAFARALDAVASARKSSYVMELAGPGQSWIWVRFTRLPGREPATLEVEALDLLLLGTPDFDRAARLLHRGALPTTSLAREALIEQLSAAVTD